MKKPIVTTDNVGCREVVDDSINGFLVPPKNSEALSNAIKKIVIDKELRKCYSDASFRKAEEEFDIHKINEKVVTEVLQLKTNNS
jgi:N,N'-diacetylbacillosaminyl-diphospho-undecaprenol alpha-1,3-N-acetylgalactosaminyltransferase